MDNFDRSSLNRAEDPSPAAATKETVVIVKGGVVEHHRFVPRKPGPTGFDLPANQASYGREAG